MGKNNQKKTHEQYVEELHVKNPNLEVLGTYINSNTKILHRCLIHDFIFEKIPSGALKGGGCILCHHDKTAAKKKKTQEQYLDELNNINPYIELVEEYKGSDTNVLHKCKICGLEWNTTPANLLSGRGCPKCSGKYRKTHEDYVRELHDANPNVVVLEKYINAKTKILHKCKVHNIEWMIAPTNALKGFGCRQCNIDATILRCTKTHDKYLAELKAINANIEPLEEYQGADKHILHRCKVCGYEWESTPSNLLSNKGCPMCRVSKGENSVKNWLEAHNIAYEPQKKFNNCRDKKPLPFDFYLPDYNICIEYDGEQHYRPVSFGGHNDDRKNEIFEYTQRHDEIKTKYCEDNGIKLIRIPYYQDVNKQLDLLLA